MASPDLHDDPDWPRASFQKTNFQAILPTLQQRFPHVQPLYLTKIFRGIITPTGLVWLDHDREEMTPSESHDLSHLLYCFEVYGQIVCLLAAGGTDIAGVEELQRALAEYRMRLLKLAKVCTFESLRDWHGAFLDEMFKNGQDSAEGWRVTRPELTQLLVRR